MATLDADDIQSIARLHRPGGSIYFVRATGGSDSNDGKSWDEAWATVSKAASTAVSGDTVLLGPGTFANGSAQINPAQGVWWFGAGIDTTLLTFSGTISAGNPHCLLNKNNRWQDLTLSCTEASNNATMGASAFQNYDVSNVMLKRIKLVSDRDCITLADLPFFRNVRIEDCFLFSTFDGLQLAGTTAGKGGELWISRTAITCVNVAAGRPAKCIICQTGNNGAKYIVTCTGCTFVSDTSGGATQSQAISVDGSQHELDFIGGSVRSVGNNPLDFLLANDPMVRVSNTFIFDTENVGRHDSLCTT